MTITINELKQMKRWIAWGNPSLDTEKDGKTKKDKSPLLMGQTKRVDEWHLRTDLWGTYDDAREWQYNVDDKDFVCHGVGIVLNGSGITFFDFDDCISEDGKVDEEALRICSHLNSYTEMSPSKRGIHVFALGEKPDWAKKQSVFKLKNGKKMEVYYAEDGSSRWSTYTEYVMFVDQYVDKGELEIAERSGEIDDILSVYRTPEFTPKPLPQSTGVRVSSEISERRIASFFEKVVQNAESAITNAGDGSYHNVRRARAKTVGGFYATCVSLGYRGMSSSEILDRLYYAKEPTSNKRMEYRTIEWGFNAGYNSPLDLPFNPFEQDEPPTPPTSPKPPKAPKNDDHAAEPAVAQEATADSSEISRILYAGLYSNTAFADAFAVWADGNYRYSYQTDELYVWDGTHWSNSNNHGLLERVIEQFLEECKVNHLDLIIKQGEKEKVIKKMNEATFQKQVEKKVQTRASISFSAGQFDNDKDLFTVNNGTIDLRTGNLLPHNKAHNISKILNVDYNPNARSTFFEDFMMSIACDDASLVNYLQVAVGYTMTGHTDLQKLFFLYGKQGRNGKTTFINNILVPLMKNHYTGINISAMTLKGANDSGANSQMASARGKRLVISQEAPYNAKLNWTYIKSLVAGDIMSTSDKYEKKIDWESQAKLWLTGNNEPNMNNEDDGAWRRYEQIPFDAYFPFETEISQRELTEKLKDALPAILAWAVKGAVQFYSTNKLPFCARVSNAIDALKQEADVLGRFIKATCDVVPDRGKEVYVSKALCYAVFSKFMEDGGEQKGKYPKVKQFAQMMRKHFGEGKSGNEFWIGVQLKKSYYLEYSSEYTDANGTSRANGLYRAFGERFDTIQKITKHTSTVDVVEYVVAGE